ncbi:MAG: hypothetical protein Q7S17_10470 [Xanthobacteraceae bacterium]|nr:hypothetical protein [Xanthobacteraceae bacterium]
MIEEQAWFNRPLALSWPILWGAIGTGMSGVGILLYIALSVSGWQAATDERIKDLEGRAITFAAEQAAEDIRAAARELQYNSSDRNIAVIQAQIINQSVATNDMRAAVADLGRKIDRLIDRRLGPADEP